MSVMLCKGVTFVKKNSCLVVKFEAKQFEVQQSLSSEIKIK